MPATLHAQAKAPHQVAICVANVIAGGIQLITGDLPQSISHATVPYVSHMWSALLVVGGLTTLVGIFIKGPVIGLRLEAAGHVGIIGGCIIYGIAAINWLATPWWPSPVVWWSFFVAIASGVRWFQIWKTMRKPREVLEGEV